MKVTSLFQSSYKDDAFEAADAISGDFDNVFARAEDGTSMISIEACILSKSCINGFLELIALWPSTDTNDVGDDSRPISKSTNLDYTACINHF